MVPSTLEPLCELLALVQFPRAEGWQLCVLCCFRLPGEEDRGVLQGVMRITRVPSPLGNTHRLRNPGNLRHMCKLSYNVYLGAQESCFIF